MHSATSTITRSLLAATTVLRRARSPHCHLPPASAPQHGLTMFVRCMGTDTSSRMMALMPPPLALPPLATLALPWNGGGGTLAACRGAPSVFNSSTGAKMWLTGFAYDINFAISLQTSTIRATLLRWRHGQPPPGPTSDQLPAGEFPRLRVPFLL